MPPIAEASEFSIRNQAQLQASHLAACYYCQSQFPASSVTEFTEEGDGTQTAWCPVCGIDAVLGDASGYDLSPSHISQLHVFWFGASSAEHCPSDVT